MEQIGKINSILGSETERYYAEFFRNIGYEDCNLSSIEDKKLDNAKIDLTNLPFNLQIKAGKHKNLSPGKELLIMKGAINSMLSSTSNIKNLPNFLLHSYSPEDGIKTEFIYMTLQTFENFKIQNPNLVYEKKKEFKFDIQEEFKVIVGVSFEYFITDILNKKYSRC